MRWLLLWASGASLQFQEVLSEEESPTFQTTIGQTLPLRCEFSGFPGSHRYLNALRQKAGDAKNSKAKVLPGTLPWLLVVTAKVAEEVMKGPDAWEPSSTPYFLFTSHSTHQLFLSILLLKYYSKIYSKSDCLSPSPQ